MKHFDFSKADKNNSTPNFFNFKCDPKPEKVYTHIYRVFVTATVSFAASHDGTIPLFPDPDLSEINISDADAVIVTVNGYNHIFFGSHLSNGSYCWPECDHIPRIFEEKLAILKKNIPPFIRQVWGPIKHCHENNEPLTVYIVEQAQRSPWEVLREDFGINIPEKF